MSCDESQEKAKAARLEKAERRSLPIFSGKTKPVEPPAVWRSMAERSRTLPESAAREFPAGASEMDGVSRRGFMQLLGASTAVAGLAAACQKPNEKIVPFVRRPEEVTPGNALHFATGFSLEGYTAGLLVESHEGHPTKIEGNPSHPETLGATTAFEQALILGLYDDDRAKQLRRGNKRIAWTTFLTETSRALRELHRQRRRGAAVPDQLRPRRRCWPTCAGASWRASRARSSSATPRCRATAPSTGPSWRSAARWCRATASTEASVILSLDSDFLDDGPEQTRLSREFAARREPSARHEPPLRRRAGHDRHRHGRRPPPAPARRRRARVHRRALRDAVGPGRERAGGAGRPGPRRRKLGLRSGWWQWLPTWRRTAAVAW